MAASPAVAVAIPLHNKAATIADAVTSVLGQSVGDFELIVVDDGSADRGAERLRPFTDPRLRVETQRNAGVAAARNRAMDSARAEFVAFLDADDLWAPDHLRHLLELSRRFPQAALFGNRFVAFDREPPAPSTAAVEYRLLDDYFAACAYGTQPFFTSSCMVRREQALRQGGFPAGHSRGEDLALWIRLAVTAPVAVSSYPGAFYRRDGVGLTRRPVTAPDISMLTLQEMLARDNDWPAARRLSAREYYNRIALAHAVDCLRAGEDAAARDFLRLAGATRAHRARWWQARLLAAAPRWLRELVIGRRGAGDLGVAGRTP